MTDNAFVTKLSEILATTPEALSDDKVVTPQEWDSIVLLDLIAAIDESFGVTVPTAELNQAATVGEIRTLIQAAVDRG